MNSEPTLVGPETVARLRADYDDRMARVMHDYTVGVPHNLPGNLWLGTTCENQAAADERIPHLLRCQAAVRFVIAEPLLGPLEIFHLPPLTCDGRRSCLPVTGPAMVAEDWGRGTFSLFPGIAWCIVGPETGPGRRPCDPEWIRGIVDQCRATGVACFVKAFPIGNRISKDMAEWPKLARVREFP